MHRTYVPTLAGLVVGIVMLAGPGCSPPYRSVKALMVVGGDYHDYQALPARLAERLTARGDVAVEVTANLADLNARKLAAYQVLIFNTCHQAELDQAARQAICDYLEAGGGLVAMHCSLWSYQSWPKWSEIIGGFAATHDKFGPYQVLVLDTAHATMAGLGTRFEIVDEPYLVDKRDPADNVLVRTAKVQTGPNGVARTGPEPQVWTKTYGKGRVFVTTFGHDARSLDSEQFVTLMHNGIRWAAGVLPDSKHNVLTLSEKQTGFELLFNGKDLAGWVGNPANWMAENGDLVGRAANLPHNVFLTHEKQFGDFELRFAVKLVNGTGNSGVQFRSRQYPDYVVKGYQVDVADQWYGSLYEEGGKRGVLANGFKDRGEKVVVIDGWNEMSVRAVGPKITINLNGVNTVEYQEQDPAAQPDRGVIALQLHRCPQMEIRFRDIRIKPLSR